MPRYDAGNVSSCGIFGVVTRRIERKRGSCKSVGVFVAVTVEEPVSKAFEVGGAVTAATSAFVDRDDRCEQLRNRGPGPTSELFALGTLAVRPADEPHSQALPPLVPHLQLGFVGGLFFARRGVPCLAAGHGLEHRVDAQLEGIDVFRNHTASADQSPTNWRYVLDETPLGVQHGVHVAVLQIDTAEDAGHESSRGLGHVRTRSSDR